MKVLPIIVFMLGVGGASAASVPAAPVPKSPYMPLIYRFADTLLQHGRDTNGAFIAALDRRTYKPIASTNSCDHQNLLRLLYTLSELSTKPKYRDAADAALRALLQNGAIQDARPWMLWNRCFDLEPRQSTQVALRLLESPATNHPGFAVRAWSAAYSRTTNETFLRAIDSLLNTSPLTSRLSFAIDCEGSARSLPEPLASRLRAFASEADDVICKTPPDISNSPWIEPSAVKMAMMFVSRYENTGKVGYRDLIHTLAASHLKSPPPEDPNLLPATLGQAISLQLAAWRSTANPAHLEKAREFGDFAMAKFFGESPLPRASLNREHYDASTGADTLALAMTELHLHVLYITAVRCPPNTIDR